MDRQKNYWIKVKSLSGDHFLTIPNFITSLLNVHSSYFSKESYLEFWMFFSKFKGLKTDGLTK